MAISWRYVIGVGIMRCYSTLWALQTLDHHPHGMSLADDQLCESHHWSSNLLHHRPWLSGLQHRYPRQAFHLHNAVASDSYFQVLRVLVADSSAWISLQILGSQRNGSWDTCWNATVLLRSILKKPRRPEMSQRYHSLIFGYRTRMEELVDQQNDRDMGQVERHPAKYYTRN